MLRFKSGQMQNVLYANLKSIFSSHISRLSEDISILIAFKRYYGKWPGGEDRVAEDLGNPTR